jgi:alkanesulfonate monooxygenase SsuD/methylene tetrahydromethanopterin reductase-like flavin-dependent oxidoreductase (luciferase family)
MRSQASFTPIQGGASLKAPLLTNLTVAEQPQRKRLSCGSQAQFKERQTDMVKFGYVMSFRNPSQLSGMSDADFYSAMFEQVEFLDQVGFDTIWTTEHHFVEDGYLSSVIPMMAAMAARTKRVKVGSFVLLGPFYHPLRLAEDAAMIDVLSNGRLRLGIGVGYRLEEFEIFQMPIKERVGRTLEGIEIMKRAWTGERFSFEGKYFNFKNALVRPKPVSPKGPELLWGGMAPKSIERSAKLDLGFACNLGAPEIARYYDALRALGKDPAGYSVVNTRQVYVADSEEQAWEEIEPGAMYQMELYSKWLSDGSIETAGRYQPDPDALRRASILGTPKQVIEQLKELVAQNPMTELALGMQQPGLDPKLAMRSLKRFGTEVLPVLRKG